MIRLPHVWLFAALALVASVPLGANARPRPLPQHALSRGFTTVTRATPPPLRRHALFGTIVQLLPNAFLLRSRNGRLQRVDDSIALQSGNYSAPLFVGKTVVADGNYDARGMLHAVTVTRMNSLDGTLPPDH